MVLHKPWADWGLEQWLNSLENRAAQEIQLGLARTMEVAKKLTLQNPECNVISVAGTNGKGSTVAALERIYHQAGYKVGAYTSPHLIRFNERIRVNLTPISDEDLCEAFRHIEEGRGATHLTYFEMTTLAALWYFKKQHLDVLILEVGLGGRLDATNIIDSDVAIITTIDFDHQEFLGSTLEEIAYEKAGILRKNKPYIYADSAPPDSIKTVANALNAPGYVYQEQLLVHESADSWTLHFADYAFSQLPKPCIQLKSAAAAIAATALLNQRMPISYESICSAMSTLFIPGRLQLQEGRINVLYDVAHNPQSVRLLAHTIKAMKNKKQVHAVFSALRDKDLFNLIFPLKDCVDRWYPAQLDNKRAATPELLLSKFMDAEIFADICYNTPLAAFEMAIRQAQVGDLIVVYGSFFTVGHVMAYQHNLFNQKEI